MTAVPSGVCAVRTGLQVAQHGAGRGSAYTRARRPLRVVFTEATPDRSAALIARSAAIQAKSASPIFASFV